MALCIAIPSLTWVALALAVVMLVVAYMINRAYPSSKLQAWISMEYKDLLMNMVLLFAFVAFYNVATFVALNILNLYGSTSLSFSSAACSLDLLGEVVGLLDFITTKKAAIGFINLLHQIHFFEIFTAYSTKITSLPGLDVGVRLAAGFEIPLQTLTLIRDGFSVFIVSLQFQALTLQAIRLIGFDLLLPLAFLLRMLPFTRGAANEMMGLLFSLTIVLPVLYLLFFSALDDVFLYMGAHSIFTPEQVDTGVLSSITNILSLLVKYGTLYQLFFSAVAVAVKEAAYFFVLAVMVPSLVFAIAITFVKTTSEVLRFQG